MVTLVVGLISSTFKILLYAPFKQKHLKAIQTNNQINF